MTGGVDNLATADPGSRSVEELAATAESVVANVRSVLFGKDAAVWLGLCCLIAEGHLLVEDYPGVGKTTFAKAIARSIGLQLKRVQFTSDLLPADVTGAMVYDRSREELVFRPGPVFTNLLLADELNRASPRAQSALLEGMEERQVSVDGTTHLLPRPFMVIATQNPFDASGTHPLPYNQRDRFSVRVHLGYPPRSAEDALLVARDTRPQVDSLHPVCGASELGMLSAALERIYVAPGLRSYVLDLVEATRRHPEIAVGASPRAALALVRVAGAFALCAGRAYVVPDDVKAVAEPVLAHRLALVPAAELEGRSASELVRDRLSRAPVPVDGDGRG